MNTVFLKAFHDKYPSRLIPKDSINGYAAAQILEAAIKKVNGNVENTDQFLQALYGTDMDTLKGHVKLDAQHDIVENSLIFEIQPDLSEKLLKTYTDVSRAWDRTPQELQQLPFGKLKNKWVGMTLPQLKQLIGPSSS